jgi:hypothetical protein
MANTITQTYLTGGAYSTEATVLNVASATNISAPVANFTQKLYVIPPDTTKGELMIVTAVNGTAISVARLDMFKMRFPVATANGGNGATVLIGPSASTGPLANGPYFGDFYEFSPSGSTTYPQPSTSQSPWVNVTTGEQWLYSSVTGLWVPGWNNPSTQKGLTAAVASAAGTITPSGPLFHVTGTAAITGFTLPIGFAGGSFTIIPDGVFTWTSAGNIALAGTAVVSKALTFQWDSNVGKWYPSYIA